MPSSEKVFAPFTVAQRASLNAYQASAVFHEYTCGSEVHQGGVALLAELDGWRCPQCAYRQLWAHASHADWSWCPLCGGTGLVEDPSACSDEEHCAGWASCPSGCPDELAENDTPTVHYVHDSDGAGGHS